MLSDTVEPSLPIIVVTPRRIASPRPGLRARLEVTPLGRFGLTCVRWAVVFGLIVCGYVGADVINAGMHRATASDSAPTAAAPPMLAASAPQQQ